MSDLTLWRPELRPYQVATLERLKDMPGSALYLDMGLGKTLLAISMFEYWHSQGKRRFVYLCQNSLLHSMADEFAKWESPLKVVVVPKGNRAVRLKAIQSDWDVLIVNYEAIRGLWQDIVRMRPECLAIDECQNIKHRTALQTKAARKIAQATKILRGHRVLMSGTPITKDILDLWSEVDIMEPENDPANHRLGFGKYKAYESSVATLIPHPRLGHRAPIIRFKPEMVTRVTERMADFSVVLRSRDVLPELPDQTFATIRLDMGDEQRRLYNAVKQDMIAVLSHEDTPATAAKLMEQYHIAPLTVDDMTVTATLATTLLVRLQQITSGFVKTSTGMLVPIPSIKHEWMQETLPELTDSFDDHKCVVFARFTHDVDTLMDLCEELNIGAVRLDGKTSKDAADLVRSLQTDPGVRALIGNIQVSATGFTMTAADNAVFFSHSHRYDHRHQALKRIHRLGQTRPVTYRDLLAGQVDESIMRSLADKQDMAVNTLEDLRNLIASL